MRSAAGILGALALCFLRQSAAFIASPSRHRILKQTPAAKARASSTSSISTVGRNFATPTSAAVEASKSGRRLFMAAGSSSREASVALYENYVGKKMWEELGMPVKKASSAFDEISSIYGEENAVKMVKAVPGCLGYDPDNFKATFDAFSENFGSEETIGMVTRNPNLLSVRPNGFGGAINAKSDTMTMSYLIAYTRPLGPVLLYGLLFALALPIIEIATGIPRGQMISVVASKMNG